MNLEYFKKPWDYELLDSGEGYRLENWGEVRLIRPDPQAIWQKHLEPAEWEKAIAVFKTRWEHRGNVPDKWTVNFHDTKFLLRLSPFKHTGLFAEQAAHWEWLMKNKANGKKVLNLFAYTGGVSMVLTKLGYSVTHVDASKPTIGWAKENQTLNGFSKDSIRWILDDAVKFAKREVKRGATYDGIILDPPAFGHSPDGKTWKFAEDFPGLLEDCIKLLTPNAQFLLVNAYATNSSALALKNVVEDAVRGSGKLTKGKMEFGELCLKQKDDRLISTGIFTRIS